MTKGATFIVFWYYDAYSPEIVSMGVTKNKKLELFWYFAIIMPGMVIRDMVFMFVLCDSVSKSLQFSKIYKNM